MPDFSRDIDIGKVSISDTETNARIETILEFILDEELVSKSADPEPEAE